MRIQCNITQNNYHRGWEYFKKSLYLLSLTKKKQLSIAQLENTDEILAYTSRPICLKDIRGRQILSDTMALKLCLANFWVKILLTAPHDKLAETPPYTYI